MSHFALPHTQAFLLNKRSRSPSIRLEDIAALGGKIPRSIHLFVCLNIAFAQSLTSFVALFVYHPELPKAVKYLSAQPARYSSRIKLVTDASSKNDPPVASGNEVEVITCFEKSFRSWITNEVRQATVTQLDGRPVGKLSLIVEDIFSGGVALACKEVHRLPIVAWWSMTAASLMR